MKISKKGWAGLAILTATIAAVVLGAAVRTRPPQSPPGAGGIQALLPQGSVLHSYMRLEMNGRPPQEIAAVAAVPKVPGATAYTYFGFILAYDSKLRRFGRAYTEALPGELPLSVDGGRLVGARDAAVFAALNDDGSSSYRVVATSRRSFEIVHGSSIQGRVVPVDSFLVELAGTADSPRQRILAWDGRHFIEQAMAAPLPLPPRGRSWYFGVRGGEIKAPSSVIHLQVRQPLRVIGTGPGRPGAIIVPDPRLDLVESGYRAQGPGTYRIRVLVPFRSDEDGFTLTLIVGEPAR